MKLHGNLLCPIYLQNAQGSIAIVVDLGVGIVVHYYDIMIPSVVDQFSEELLASRSTDGVVWIVEKHDLRPSGDICWDGIEVR